MSRPLPQLLAEIDALLAKATPEFPTPLRPGEPWSQEVEDSVVALIQAYPQLREAAQDRERQLDLNRTHSEYDRERMREALEVLAQKLEFFRDQGVRPDEWLLDEWAKLARAARKEPT